MKDKEEGQCLYHKCKADAVDIEGLGSGLCKPHLFLVRSRQDDIMIPQDTMSRVYLLDIGSMSRELLPTQYFEGPIPEFHAGGVIDKEDIVIMRHFSRDFIDHVIETVPPLHTNNIIIMNIKPIYDKQTMMWITKTTHLCRHEDVMVPYREFHLSPFRCLDCWKMISLQTLLLRQLEDDQS